MMPMKALDSPSDLAVSSIDPTRTSDERQGDRGAEQDSDGEPLAPLGLLVVLAPFRREIARVRIQHEDQTEDVDSEEHDRHGVAEMLLDGDGLLGDVAVEYAGNDQCQCGEKHEGAIVPGGA